MLPRLVSVTSLAPLSVPGAVERAAEVAETVARPLSARTDSGVWPAEVLAALQAAGLGGLAAPRQFGGSGLGLRGVASVAEAVGRVDASAAICFGMHCVGTAVIAAKPTERQRKESPNGPAPPGLRRCRGLLRPGEPQSTSGRGLVRRVPAPERGPGDV